MSMEVLVAPNLIDPEWIKAHKDDVYPEPSIKLFMDGKRLGEVHTSRDLRDVLKILRSKECRE